MVLSNLSPSLAQLSSDYHCFSVFPATADIVNDVDGLDNIFPSWSSSTSTSMRMIFLTNQRPRKCDMTYRQKIIYRHFDNMTTNAFRAAAVINDACKKIADFHVGLDSQLGISPYTTLIIERVYCLTSPQPLGKSSHRRSK